jgi:eukaryotic-like serine/threonine-protein kinase
MLGAGSRLGPYEIGAPLGAGGMGEVYRARDTRLDREVAIKVLPAHLAEDSEALARFEREAKAVAALSHPNILAIHDFGRIEGQVFAVTELLEGETLRQRLELGALPVRKVAEIGVRIAEGLAAAHEKGIVHRDLKPENLFLCRDGRVKILDFGLAKAIEPAGDGGRTLAGPPTEVTSAGTLLGTAAYMAPEQVRGAVADHRTDIFAFGAVLFEMLSGGPAFRRETGAETMAAIVREDPPNLLGSGRNIPPAFDRIIRRCLEKNPAERFQSARDLAFDLQSLSDFSAVTTGEQGKAPSRASGWPRRLVLVALVGGALAVAFAAGTRLAKRPTAGTVSFEPLTYRQEPIFSARFAPDGKTILYSDAPVGNAPEIFSLRPGFPGSSSLGLHNVHLLAVSSQGELAVLTHARYVAHSFCEGTLARMPLLGGAPREIVDHVREADWSPDGSALAIIRDVDGTDRLEYPIGTVLYEAGGYLSNPRFSPRGDKIAFFEHPVQWDDRGLVAVVDLQGHRKVLSEGYWGEEGLAWSPSGHEVFFSAGVAYNNFRVLAVDFSGHTRVALESAGGVTIQDVAADGRWLVTRDDYSGPMPVLAPGPSGERDLSWLDLSTPAAMTPDGKTLLFSEESGSVGLNYAVCLRRTDGSPVVRLGEGSAADLSYDGRWALSVVPTSPQRIVIYPTGAGEPRRLERGDIVSYDTARFFPDAQRVLACGHESGRASRCYVQEVAGGKPRALTPEGTSEGFVSPDGKSVVVSSSSGGLQLFSVEGGQPKTVAGAKPGDEVIAWSSDARSLLVSDRMVVPRPVERLDLSTGARVLVRQLGPSDLSGVLRVGPIVMIHDGEYYAYSSRSMISHLFLVRGAT